MHPTPDTRCALWGILCAFKKAPPAGAVPLAVGPDASLPVLWSLGSGQLRSVYPAAAARFHDLAGWRPRGACAKNPEAGKDPYKKKTRGKRDRVERAPDESM